MSQFPNGGGKVSVPATADLKAGSIQALIVLVLVHYSGILAVKLQWPDTITMMLTSFWTQAVAFGLAAITSWWLRRNANKPLTLTGAPKVIDAVKAADAGKVESAPNVNRVASLLLLFLLPVFCGGCLPQDASPAMKIMDWNGKLTAANDGVAELVRAKVVKPDQARIYQQAALEARDALDAAEAKLQPDGTLAWNDQDWLDRANSAISRVVAYLLRYQQLKKGVGSSEPTTREVSESWKFYWQPLSPLLCRSFNACLKFKPSTRPDRPSPRMMLSLSPSRPSGMHPLLT